MRVTAVIVNQRQVLLMHRKKAGHEYWIFPGGSVEEGETETEALAREVKEETSLEIKFAEKRGSFKGKGEINPIFYCEVTEGEPKIAEDSPEAKLNSMSDWYQLEWINIEKALKYKKLYPKEGKDIIRELLKQNKK